MVFAALDPSTCRQCTLAPQTSFLAEMDHAKNEMCWFCDQLQMVYSQMEWHQTHTQ